MERVTVRPNILTMQQPYGFALLVVPAKAGIHNHRHSRPLMTFYRRIDIRFIIDDTAYGSLPAQGRR
jgi:hypothetical protein